MQTQQLRPTGVTVLSVCLVVFSLINAFSLAINPFGFIIPPLPLLIVIYGLTALILVATFGLWNLQRWGYSLSLVVLALTFLLSLFGVFRSTFGVNFDPLTVLGVITALPALIYLRQPAVRKVFA